MRYVNLMNVTTADTITSVFGIRFSGSIVTGLVTRGLRALAAARSLLMQRLSGLVPAWPQVVVVCHARRADGGHVGVLSPVGLGMPWSSPWQCPVKRGASGLAF